jgi:uncharacterized protein DUF6627
MFRRLIASLLIVSLIAPIPVQAGLVSTQRMLDQERIMTVVDRAEVRAQLQAHGVNSTELKARVAALTEEEAAELAARIDSLPAGGIDILGAAVLIFLVLLLTDILGFTKIFPFTKPIK